MTDLKTLKKNLRKEMLEKLKRYPAMKDAAAPLRARDLFLEHFSKIDVKAKIAVTLPMEFELDTGPLIDALVAKGHALCLPVMVQKGEALLFRRYQPGDALEEKIWGLREPLASSPEIIPDIVLCPLVAFDRQGRRLGHGAGYYDATLKKLRAQRKVQAIGLCWAMQEVPEVLVGNIDQRLDAIVTEKEVILPPTGQGRE